MRSIQYTNFYSNDIVSLGYTMSLSPPANYDSIKSEAAILLQKYLLGDIVRLIKVEDINRGLLVHRDLLVKADTYENTIQLIGQLQKQLGVQMDVIAFIKLEADRKRLYELFRQWRTLLLSSAC